MNLIASNLTTLMLELILSTIPKPQDTFEEKLDNSTAPFTCKLRVKVHALEEIDVTSTSEEDDMQKLIEDVSLLTIAMGMALRTFE